MPAKISRVAKARKDRGSCVVCHDPIVAGDSYGQWTHGFRGPVRRFHDRPACQPLREDLEANEKRADLVRLENAVAAASISETAEDAAAVVLEARDHAVSVREAMEEAIAGWDSAGLTGSSLYEAFTNDVSELESFESEAEQLASRLEAWDPDDEEDPDEWTQWIEELSLPELEF